MKNIFILLMIVLGLTSCQEDIVEPSKVSKGKWKKSLLELTMVATDKSNMTITAEFQYTSFEIVRLRPTDKSGYLKFHNDSGCEFPLFGQTALGSGVINVKEVNVQEMLCK